MFRKKRNKKKNLLELLDLPPEILVHIFTFFGKAQELCKAELISKGARDIALSDVVWKACTGQTKEGLKEEVKNYLPLFTRFFRGYATREKALHFHFLTDDHPNQLAQTILNCSEAETIISDFYVSGSEFKYQRVILWYFGTHQPFYKMEPVPNYKCVLLCMDDVQKLNKTLKKIYGEDETVTHSYFVVVLNPPQADLNYKDRIFIYRCNDESKDSKKIFHDLIVFIQQQALKMTGKYFAINENEISEDKEENVKRRRWRCTIS